MGGDRNVTFLYGSRLETKTIEIEPLIRFDQNTGAKIFVKQYEYHEVFVGTDIEMSMDDHEELYDNSRFGDMLGILIADIDLDYSVVPVDMTGNDKIRDDFNKMIDEHFNPDDAKTIKDMAGFVIHGYCS